jgi:hypothetical protein
MKKITYLQAGIIAVLTLTIGVLMGLFLNFPKTKSDEFAGSIGKVDRFRNVQMTEEDILLRNELVEDTAKRAQYEKYLLYYYYQALRTSSDMERILAIAKAEYEFEKVYYPYSNTLTNFKTYLETARTDILTALNIIISIDQNQEVPVVNYLNQAQNAIARIRTYDQVLINYMIAMATYIETHPEAYLYKFIDAHDILALNIIHSALLTQNKPVLSYLEKKKLLNDKERMKDVVAETQLKSSMNDNIIMDFEKVQGVIAFDSEKLKGIEISDMENLQALISNNIVNLNSVILLNVAELGNIGSLENIISSFGQLQIVAPV